MNKYEFHCSFYEAIYFTLKILPVTLLSFIPSLLLQPMTFSQTVTAYGMNFLFVTAVFLFGLITAGKKMIVTGRRRILLKKGVCFQQKLYPEKQSIKSISAERRLLPMLFRAEKINIYTGTKTGRQGDFSFFLSKKEKLSLFDAFFDRSAFQRVYKAGFFRILLMSLTSSNALAGLLILIPFIKKTGELLGKYYENALYSSLDTSPYISAWGVHPFSAAVASALLMGFAVSVLSVFFNYFALEIKKEQGYFLISRGLLEKTYFLTSSAKINAFELKQSLLMSVLHLYNLKGYACGFGKERKSKNILVPLLTAKQARAFLSVQPKQKILTPPKSALKTYLYLPFICFCITAVLCLLPQNYFVDTEPFFPLLLLALFLCFLWFLMRIFAFKKAFVCADDQKVIVSFYKRLSFTKTLIPFSKIQAAAINQSIFQRYRNICSLKIFVYSEKRRCFMIKHLGYKQALQLYGQINQKLQENG